MKLLIYTAAIAAAVITVLSTRLLVPGLIIIFKAIEQSFEPDDIDTSTPVLSAPLPVIVAEEEPQRKPRKARRRKPSAKTLASIAALA